MLVIVTVADRVDFVLDEIDNCFGGQDRQELQNALEHCRGGVLDLRCRPEIVDFFGTKLVVLGNQDEQVLTLFNLFCLFGGGRGGGV